MNMLNGFPSGKHPERMTGAGAYTRTGSVLPDDSDLSHADVADLVVTFCHVMDRMTYTTNTGTLALFGLYAAKIWREMVGRGVEFK
jgi:hypothetical protein